MLEHSNTEMQASCSCERLVLQVRRAFCICRFAQNSSGIALETPSGSCGSCTCGQITGHSLDKSPPLWHKRETGIHNHEDAGMGIAARNLFALAKPVELIALQEYRAAS